MNFKNIPFKYLLLSLCFTIGAMHESKGMNSNSESAIEPSLKRNLKLMRWHFNTCISKCIHPANPNVKNTLREKLKKAILKIKKSQSDAFFCDTMEKYFSNNNFSSRKLYKEIIASFNRKKDPEHIALKELFNDKKFLEIISFKKVFLTLAFDNFFQAWKQDKQESLITLRHEIEIIQEWYRTEQDESFLCFAIKKSLSKLTKPRPVVEWLFSQKSLFYLDLAENEAFVSQRDKYLKSISEWTTVKTSFKKDVPATKSNPKTTLDYKNENIFNYLLSPECDEILDENEDDDSSTESDSSTDSSPASSTESDFEDSSTSSDDD